MYRLPEDIETEPLMADLGRLLQGLKSSYDSILVRNFWANICQLRKRAATRRSLV